MDKFISFKEHFKQIDIEVWGLRLPIEETTLKEYLKQLNASITSDRKEIGEKRWNEFCSGRLCALKAAKELSIDLGWLEKKESGAAHWPEVLTGSISHSKSYAIAASAKSCEYISIGCDIEEIVTSKRIEVIKGMVLSEEEQTFLQHKKIDHATIATLMFSAKESLYKLVNPLTSCYLNFHEGIIKDIDSDKKTFSIELRSDKKEYLSYCGVYHGYYYVYENNLITLLAIAKSKEL